MTLLQATATTVRRRDGSVLSFPALELAAGSRTLLLGPSGCGKTTWLSVIGGLLRPTDGTVYYGDTEIYKLSSRMRDRWRGQHCGFIFQTLHLIPSLNLRQNIALAATLAGLPADNNRIDALLERLQLSGKARRKPSALSQGEQQRAAIARAVLNRPALIIADEPTSALDDAQTTAVMDMLESCAAESGAGLLVATHDNRLQQRFARHIVMSAPERITA